MSDSDRPAIVILTGQPYEVCASGTLSPEAVAQYVSGRLGGVWKVIGEAQDCSVEEDRMHWIVEEVK